jgi:hypothetical protein
MKNGLPNVEKPGAIPKAVYFRPIHDLMKGYSLVAKWCKQLFISNEQKL